MIDTANVAMLFDQLHEAGLKPMHERNWQMERELTDTLIAELKAQVPSHINDAYHVYRERLRATQRAYDGVVASGRFADSDPGYLAAAKEQDAAWTEYDRTLTEWFVATVGRPMHDHEPGIFTLFGIVGRR